ncbi:RNA polymerase sigma-70 factor, ECF subfamily [Actinacidiphila paucisporea]|uniref:RNA polymerase sigma-70 factor, ECF subfamily n=2 Tax=Actinacidiphila paucisporea TaxID=310782 RepID=A0A1M7ANG5_9ACTN|nr:RNA polymerase sigma factor [Actinacidiphila paucisporea]SHL44280.1 RNA polymerase sigma-70 factor, ECF subfamily [Actinacidiphila paucisporea]
MRGAATYEEGTVVGAGGRRRARADDGALGRAVTRARDGDEAAFGVVYRAVQPMLLGYVRGLVGDDADDVAADAWHDIVRDLAAFHGDGAAFRAWTATIARHRALDHLRRLGSRPRTTALDTVAGEPAAAPDTAGVALENLSTARALAMIAALPPDQAEAVLLRVVVGLSSPAAAEVLGKRPGAVRTAAHRGLRRLAEQLAPPRGSAAEGAPGAGDAMDGPGVLGVPGAVDAGGGGDGREAVGGPGEQEPAGASDPPGGGGSGCGGDGEA